MPDLGCFGGQPSRAPVDGSSVSCKIGKMTRAEAIRAMDRGTRVRIGRFRNPESCGYCEGVIDAIHRRGWVSVEDDGGTTYLRPLRTVRRANVQQDRD
jgi:hypothetical protein